MRPRFGRSYGMIFSAYHKKWFSKINCRTFFKRAKQRNYRLTVISYVGIIRIRFMGRGRTSSQLPHKSGLKLPNIQFLNCVLL